MTAMQVQLIEGLDGFAGLRQRWEELHVVDQHASIFLSWSWLRGWLEVAPYPWAVLAARTDADSPWVGFFPISLRGNGSRYRMDQIRELHMAGDPAADYTGLICAAEFEQPVLRGFADFIARQLRWDRMRLKELNDPRVEILVGDLSPRIAQVRSSVGTCCPYIELPTSWEEYLHHCLTYETRKSLRKKMRLVERDCRVTHLDGENDHAQIEALIHLAALREYEGHREHLPRCRTMFHWCAQTGIARVMVIWHGQTPIAAMGAFVDAKANSLNLYLTGFDARYQEYSPGRVVNALCVQQAIDEKLSILDFLRGEESYKFQFGAQRRFTRHITVIRRGLHSATRLTVNRVRARFRI